MRLALVLAAAASAAAAAEGESRIYRWTDERGGVHYTRDLGAVPPAERDAALDAARREAPSRLQTYSPHGSDSRRAEPAPPAGRPAAAAALPLRGALQIPFVRSGTLMLVNVRLNDRVEAPFLIDTGASGISIPDAVARQLGVRIDADTPRLAVQTASGVVSEPLIQLDSVQVGPARVERLPALVNSSMEVGLLGGSFFNNFVYEVDAAAGVITLRPNDAVRGGLVEAQWRERFRSARHELERVEAQVDGPAEGSARRAQLERSLQARRDAFEALEREANASDVPRSWRE